MTFYQIIRRNQLEIVVIFIAMASLGLRGLTHPPLPRPPPLPSIGWCKEIEIDMLPIEIDMLPILIMLPIFIYFLINVNN